MSVVSVRVERLAEWAINWPEEFNGANPAEPNSVIMQYEKQIMRQSRAWMLLPFFLSICSFPSLLLTETCCHQVVPVISEPKSLGCLLLKLFEDVAQNRRKRVVWGQHFAAYVNRQKWKHLNFIMGRLNRNRCNKENFILLLKLKPCKSTFFTGGHKNLS